MLRAIVLAALLSQPAAALASPTLLDTINVDAASQQPVHGKAKLTAGADYSLVVTGTITDQQDRSPVSVDALYCYASNNQQECQPHPGDTNWIEGLLIVGITNSDSDGPLWNWGPNGGPSPNAPPGPPAPEYSYQSSHTYTVPFHAPAAGTLVAGSIRAFGRTKANTDCSHCAGIWTIKVYGTARAPAPPSATKVAVGKRIGKVEVQRGGGGFEALDAGEQVEAGDRIHTGWKSSVQIRFPDGFTTTVEPMTLISIHSVTKHEVRILMTYGRIENYRLTGSEADFKVGTPTTTTSSRGTRFSVLYTGSSTLVSVTQHKVEVKPRHGKAVIVTAGHEVLSTAGKVGKPTRIGKAGVPRGSVGPAQALGLLTAAVSSGVAACKADVVSSSLVPSARGWRMALKLQAPQAGTAVFTIAGRTVQPANALANEIAGGCPATARARP